MAIDSKGNRMMGEPEKGMNPASIQVNHEYEGKGGRFLVRDKHDGMVSIRCVQPNCWCKGDYDTVSLEAFALWAEKEVGNLYVAPISPADNLCVDKGETCEF